MHQGLESKPGWIWIRIRCTRPVRNNGIITHHSRWKLSVVTGFISPANLDPDVESNPDPDLESKPNPDLESKPDPDLESTPDPDL